MLVTMPTGHALSMLELMTSEIGSFRPIGFFSFRGEGSESRVVRLDLQRPSTGVVAYGMG
jgi:hypothetical protein